MQQRSLSTVFGLVFIETLLISSALCRHLRRRNMISHEVSLIRDIRDREFKIFTDAGRVCRPLFVIDNDPESENRW